MFHPHLSYEQQNQAFIKHATQQIASWEQQKQGLEQQLNALNSLLQSPPPSVFMPPQMAVEQQQQPPPMNMIAPMDNLMPAGMLVGNNGNESYMQPPPRNNFFIPDLSKPPPGFGAPGSMADGAPVIQPVAQAPAPVLEAIPLTPYFNLPAGLMAPFIRLEDCSYKALDPEEIVLPPPTPPSERLLMAVESFYSLPSHERPRDGDGWEKLALYEYYKVKNQAKKQKEEAIQKGQRERSRSPSPITIESRVKKGPKRRYRSESRSPDKIAAPTAPATPARVIATPALLEDEDRRVRSRSRERSSSGGGGARGRRHSRDRRSDSPSYEPSNSRPERTSRGRQRDISPPSTPVIG